MAVGKLKKYSLPLFSLRFLSYLAIVSVIVISYNSITFYNKYGTDLFAKSLTQGQHLKLILLINLSLIHQLIIPIFFFSGALLYRALRLKGVSFSNTIKKDALFLIPIMGLLWMYGAYYEQKNSAKSYAMIWEIEELAPGEKLNEENIQHELFAVPDLTGLNNEIASLKKSRKELKAGEGEFDPVNDYTWKLQRLEQKVKMIHLRPIYQVLSLLFGMLLGYTLYFNRFLFVVMLISIGYSWYYLELKLGQILKADYIDNDHFTILIIALLLIVNSTLLLFHLKSNNQSYPPSKMKK